MQKMMLNKHIFSKISVFVHCYFYSLGLVEGEGDTDGETSGVGERTGDGVSLGTEVGLSLGSGVAVELVAGSGVSVGVIELIGVGVAGEFEDAGEIDACSIILGEEGAEFGESSGPFG